MKEYQSTFTRDEFQDRAAFFKGEIIKISREAPFLLVEVENKTLTDLEANIWALKKSAGLKKHSMYEKAFVRGREMEIESADKSSVLIAIHGRKKLSIREFIKRVEETAKSYRGKQVENDGEITIFDGSENDYNLFIGLIYNFN